MAELGFREKLEHSGRQQVRRGMTINFERLGIFVGQDAQICIFLQRTSEVNEIAVVFCGEGGVRQSRADGLGDLKRGRATRNFLHAPIGELYVNAVCHKCVTCR